jgi:conjugal transfer pilus assembly protein TraF
MKMRTLIGLVLLLVSMAMLGMPGIVSAADVLAQAPASSQQADRNWWQDTPWHDSERGFNWYPPDAPPKKKEAKAVPPKPKAIQQMTTMEEVRKELDRLKDLAVLKPTNTNVHNYLVAQNWMMDKGSVFADTARRVVWQNPDVDYNSRTPIANFALSTQRDMQRAKQYKTLAELSRDYGLMFFFRGDCPYCHQQAPVLKMLEAQYGLPVLAVSMDGGSMPQFPNAKLDNGIAMQVSAGRGISTVPALFLVNRQTHESVAVGSGILAMDEIVERVRVLTSTTPGQEF